MSLSLTPLYDKDFKDKGFHLEGDAEDLANCEALLGTPVVVVPDDIGDACCEGRRQARKEGFVIAWAVRSWELRVPASFSGLPIQNCPWCGGRLKREQPKVSHE